MSKPQPATASSLFEVPEALLMEASRLLLPRPGSFMLGLSAAILLSGGFLLLLAPLVIWVLWFWVIAQEPGTSEPQAFAAGHVVVDRADGQDGSRYHAMLAVVWLLPSLCLGAFTLVLGVVEASQGGPQALELLGLFALCFGLPAAFMAWRAGHHLRAIGRRKRERALGGAGRLAFAIAPLGKAIELVYARPLSLRSGARNWQATLRIEERRQATRSFAKQTLLEVPLDPGAFHRTRWGIRAAWHVDLADLPETPAAPGSRFTYSHWLILVVDAGTVDSRFEVKLPDPAEGVHRHLAD